MSLLLLETPSSFYCYLGCCSCRRLQGIQFYHQRLCKIPSDYISRMTDVALGNLNSDETTVIVGAKPMWELQIWKSINTKRKGILIKLKIHFITKKKYWLLLSYGTFLQSWLWRSIFFAHSKLSPFQLVNWKAFLSMSWVQVSCTAQSFMIRLKNANHCKDSDYSALCVCFFFFLLRLQGLL